MLKYGSSAALEAAVPVLDAAAHDAAALNARARGIFEAVLAALWATLRVAEAYNDDPAVPKDVLWADTFV